MGVLIGGGILIAAIILIVSGKARVLARGFINLFMDNLAKTPEGAAAVYQEAIEESQNKYNKASDALQLASGQLQTAHDALVAAKKKHDSIDKQCHTLAKANKFEEVTILAEELQLVAQEIEDLTTTIFELTKVRDETQGLFIFHEKELLKLKTEKQKVVNEIKRNLQVKGMYDTMDELKRTSNVDKLLGAVKEGVKENKEKAIGAKVVHENKRTTKVNRAENTATTLGTDDYVSKLKAQYNKANNVDTNKQINKNQL